MSKVISNIPASIKAKLKNIAVNSGKDFNKILKQYVQERFLYRLSESSYSGNFILKGALLFLAYNISRTRPTRDIDFLGDSISNNAKDIKNIIKAVVSENYKDGLIFDKKNIEVTDIIQDGEYHGVRVKINAKLGSIKERIQIDIGFGDKIIAGPLEIEFPTLIDLPAPKLKVYSLETAISEKFETIVSLQLQTSRMKDFYDIYFIASNNSFELDKLNKAITTTFENRSTSIKDCNSIFNYNFKTDQNKRDLWNTFIIRNKSEETLSFNNVVEFIQNFIQPACNKFNKNKIWNPNKAQWE